MAAGEERRRQALILSRIRRLQRRLNSEVWLSQAVVPLWCAATAAALHRVLLRSHTALVVPMLFGAAAVWWWTRVRRRRVSEQDAAVLLDRQAGAGGLLLTRLELPVGAWELGLNESVRRAPLPDVRRGRPVAWAGLAVLFLAASLLVPLPKRVAPPTNAAAASRLAQLEAKAEALAEASPLEEGVEGELARLREELEAGAFDAADWEAADGLEGTLARNAAEAAAELGRAAEAADGLAQGDTMEREALERALMALDSEAGTGAEALQNALAQLGKEGGTGSPSELSKLRDALRERQERLENAFGGNGQAGDGRQRAQGGKGRPGEGRGEGDGAAVSEGNGQGHGDRGGPSRGGGEGTLRFDQPVDMDPSRLAFAPLPKGEGGDPGELWGLRAADPKPSTESSTGSSPSGITARGEQAPAFDQSARLPRNRELVRRYFDSQHK